MKSVRLPFAQPLSLALRIGLLFAVVVAVVVGVVGHWLYWFLDREVARQDSVYLADKATLVRHLLAKPEATRRPDLGPHGLEDLLLGEKRLYVSIYDDQGRLVKALNPLALPLSGAPPAADPAADPAEFLTWVAPPQNRPIFLAAARALTADHRQLTVVLGLDVSPYKGLLDTYHDTTLISTALAALVAAGMGFLLSRRVLTPIKAIAQTADNISTHHLKQRLHLEEAPRELRQLAAAFNRMLDRLDESFSRVSRFSSDMAHELRTPINNLMVQTQVILSKPRGAEDYRAVLESNAEEYERLSRMIEQMLFLAYAESARPRLAELDVRAEIAKLVDFFEPVTEEREIRIDASGEAALAADPMMLRRALSNLIANAVRHTPPGERILIEVVNGSGGTVEVNVTNTGVIPAEHLPRLFDRFYRIEPARQHSVGGSGLGLAIVKSIMDMHGGNVTVRSAVGSTTFVLHFPRASGTSVTKSPSSDADSAVPAVSGLLDVSREGAR